MTVKSKIAKRINDEISAYLSDKASLDSKINLSKKGTKKEQLSVDKVENDDGYMTLLSEGSVLYQDGTIRLYIAKGTLTNFYNSIDNDYEGYVTVGHVDTNAFPVRQGSYSKQDLKLVYDEDGRADLLVKPKINTELSFFKDLLIQDEPFAISSEFSWNEMQEPNIEEYAKLVVYNIEKGGDIYVPITDDIHITGFSFVANPGNAKSGGYEPSVYLKKGEEKLTKKEILDKVLEHLNAGVAKEAEPVEDKKEEVAEEEAVEAEVVEKDEISGLLAKATERIEALEKEVADMKVEKEKLEKEKEELEKESTSVTEQFSKLETILNKTNLSVEAPEEKKEEPTKSIFGRERFGGK